MWHRVPFEITVIFVSAISEKVNSFLTQTFYTQKIFGIGFPQIIPLLIAALSSAPPMIEPGPIPNIDPLEEIPINNANQAAYRIPSWHRTT